MNFSFIPEASLISSYVYVPYRSCTSALSSLSERITKAVSSIFTELYMCIRSLIFDPKQRIPEDLPNLLNVL